MLLGDQCSFPSMRCVLLCGGTVYEGISRPIKYSHSDQSLHAMINCLAFAVYIRIRTNGIGPILILCAQSFVCICIRHSHSHYAQVESQLKAKIPLVHNANMTTNANDE